MFIKTSFALRVEYIPSRIWSAWYKYLGERLSEWDRKATEILSQAICKAGILSETFKFQTSLNLHRPCVVQQP